MAENDQHLQEINEEMYKRNVELAVVNKALSLLRKLYQISLQALDPGLLSEKISEAVRVDLNLEMVGVFLFDAEEDSLKPFPFAKSERLDASSKKLNFSFDQLKLTFISEKPTLKQVIYDKKQVTTNNLDDIWSGSLELLKLKIVTEESHLKTTLLFPLTASDKTIGLLILGLNRDYETLNQFEKDSINSVTDVIAVALDKSLLYGQVIQANDQLKNLDKARAEFISIASHQLRTPPATIKWYLAAVLGGDFGAISEEVKKAIINAKMTNDSLISLIDDLLNASRIERGKLEFLFEPTDLIKITQITVDQLMPQATQKGLKLTFTPPKEQIPLIIADQEKLRQVINNFIDNAIKYTHTGFVKVEISKTDTDVILKVIDSGKGVNPADKEKIFDKYDKGTVKTYSNGLGLGLYVAKVVIDTHKGKIWVDSAGEDRGSAFCISLPIKSNLKEATFDLVKQQK